MGRCATALLVLAVAVVTGCGDAGAEVTGVDVTRGDEPGGEPRRTNGHPVAGDYAGPLYVSRDDAEHPQAGAAGDVVDCDAWGSGAFSDVDVYGEGATAETPERALETARSEGIYSGVQEGLHEATRQEDRVLYVFGVESVIKQAVIVRHGPATEGAGGPGWYVESWARCDYSEFPRSFTDSMGLQIWTDSAGEPVPTTVIESRTGPEHCDWQSMTFLYIGEAVYVREPLEGLDEFFDEPYRRHADVPVDAGDTGYERDGQRLWLSADEQRAYVGTEDDAEVWPRTIRHLGCV